MALRAPCTCPNCGAPATVVASTFYGWDDTIHFDELRRAVRHADLSATEAADLLKGVQKATQDEAALRQELRALTRRIRSVTLVRGAQAADVERVHQTTGMLLIILGALVTACGRQGSATPQPTSKRLLLVDANQEAAECLADLLVLSGFEVRVALNGPTALQVEAAFRPHVCLLDVGLPPLSYYELARRMQAGGAARAPQLQFIAISGYGQAADHARSREAGFRAHLVKPVVFDHLTELLRSC